MKIDYGVNNFRNSNDINMYMYFLAIWIFGVTYESNKRHFFTMKTYLCCVFRRIEFSSKVIERNILCPTERLNLLVGLSCHD